MKKFILILLGSFLIFSCNNKKISELNMKILKLEELNKSLSDSIEKDKLFKASGTELIMFSDSENHLLDDLYMFKGILYEHQKYKSYNVYKVDSPDEFFQNYSNKELLLSKQKESEFEFNFQPTSKKDSILYFIVEFEFEDNTKVEIPGSLKIKIED